MPSKHITNLIGVLKTEDITTEDREGIAVGLSMGGGLGELELMKLFDIVITFPDSANKYLILGLIGTKLDKKDVGEKIVNIIRENRNPAVAPLVGTYIAYSSGLSESAARNLADEVLAQGDWVAYSFALDGMLEKTEGSPEIAQKIIGLLKDPDSDEHRARLIAALIRRDCLSVPQKLSLIMNFLKNPSIQNFSLVMALTCRISDDADH